MSEQIKAPWTDEQVAALTRWQIGWMHPFTCGNDHGLTGVGPGIPKEVLLLPTNDGWRCPLGCGWEQDWAHDFMFDPPPDPFAAIRGGGG